MGTSERLTRAHFHVNRSDKRLHGLIYAQAFPYFRIKAGDQRSWHTYHIYYPPELPAAVRSAAGSGERRHTERK